MVKKHIYEGLFAIPGYPNYLFDAATYDLVKILSKPIANELATANILNVDQCIVDIPERLELDKNYKFNVLTDEIYGERGYPLKHDDGTVYLVNSKGKNIHLGYKKLIGNIYNALSAEHGGPQRGCSKDDIMREKWF